MSVKAYCPFFNWVVWVFCCCWVVWGVCIFWRLSSHWLHYLQIFSTSLFILFMVSFSVWKLIGLIGFHLFIFVFISIALGDWPKKTLIWFMSEKMFCFCFLLRVLWCYVLCLSFFLCMVRGHVLTSLINIQLSFPNTTCWREYLFPIVYSCLLLSEINWS